MVRTLSALALSIAVWLAIGATLVSPTVGVTTRVEVKFLQPGDVIEVLTPPPLDLSLLAVLAVAGLLYSALLVGRFDPWALRAAAGGIAVIAVWSALTTRSVPGLAFTFPALVLAGLLITPLLLRSVPQWRVEVALVAAGLVWTLIISAGVVAAWPVEPSTLGRDVASLLIVAAVAGVLVALLRRGRAGQLVVAGGLVAAGVWALISPPSIAATVGALLDPYGQIMGLPAARVLGAAVAVLVLAGSPVITWLLRRSE